jgi:outer membrane protein assembly factor BamB
MHRSHSTRWRFSAGALLAVLSTGLATLALAGCAGPSTAESDRPAKGKKPAARRAAAKTGADAWPMFGGTPERNMVNTTAKNLVSSWKVEAPAKNIKWVAKLGDRAYGGPAIAGGQVYMGTNNRAPRDPKVKGPKGVLMCFEEKTGKFLWQLAHDMPPADVHHGEALNEGLCSTPCVDGDRLYYVTPGSELVCASTKGKVVWKYDMMKKLKVFPCLLNNCSPMVAEGLVFVMTGNGHDGHSDTIPEPNAPSFAAFTKDGELKWKSNAPGKNIMKGQWSNPAYGKVNGKGQVVFPGGDGWLYAFEPTTGKLLWKFDCNPKGAAFKAGGGKVTANFIVATPVIHDGRVYVGTGLEPDNPAGSGPGHFWCVKMDNKGGDVSHEVVVDAKAKPPKTKVNPKSALAWHFGGPIVPVPKEGREVHMGRTISTCAVKDGLVYLAEFEGYLHCLDAKTGAKYWEHDFKSAVWGCPAWIDGKIYIGDEDSDVFVFAAGKKKKQLGDPIEMGEGIPSTLVAANGTLYIATKSKLFAIGKK